MFDPIRSGRPNPCNGCEFRYPACSARCTRPEKLDYDEEQRIIRENRKKYQCPIWKHGDRDPRKG